ncbi:hypothetical protein [Ruegeria sp. HKCCD7255]|uniref:hypothetical protein n=1 Tax=Ruegeria sp. HKCCD7255 TaxID=2683004 RepID=UPI001489F477|nr:hypothetical protein [Ruegeria sp. HKCCD7255]
MHLRTVLLAFGASIAPLPVVSQSADALQLARSLDACSGAKVLRAKVLSDGSLKVSCARQNRRQRQDQLPGVAPGATNVVGLQVPALGLGAAAAAVAAGTSSTSSTDSTGSN